MWAWPHGCILGFLVTLAMWGMCLWFSCDRGSVRVLLWVRNGELFRWTKGFGTRWLEGSSASELNTPCRFCWEQDESFYSLTHSCFWGTGSRCSMVGVCTACRVLRSCGLSVCRRQGSTACATAAECLQSHVRGLGLKPCPEFYGFKKCHLWKLLKSWLSSWTINICKTLKKKAIITKPTGLFFNLFVQQKRLKETLAAFSRGRCPDGLGL